MPRSVEDTVEFLNDQLRLSARDVITFKWPEFYELNEIERWKEPRGAELQRIAKGEYGLLIQFGHNAVVVARDRNFAPV